LSAGKLRHIDASSQGSIWFDNKDEGSLAVERARALLALYEEYIQKGLKKLNKAGEVSGKFLHLLRDRFDLTI
jgi:hypothetical protein